MVGTREKLEYTNALQVVGLEPNYVDRDLSDEERERGKKELFGA